MAPAATNQRSIAEIVMKMRYCPQPIISLVHGPACGGGFAMAYQPIFDLGAPRVGGRTLPDFRTGDGAGRNDADGEKVRVVSLWDSEEEARMVGERIEAFRRSGHKLAEIATTAHVVRTFVNDCIQRLLDGKLDAEAAYMAKWWCSEQQCRVVDECLQMFGGYGYMYEYPIARMYTTSRVQKIYGGANEVMKELIARKL